MLPDIDFEYREMVDTLTVDDLDRQLTQCLGVDGRASFAAIAEILGVSDEEYGQLIAEGHVGDTYV